MKSNKQYYTIGDLSKIYGVGVDSIRYYEERGLLVPARGENGYRYYDIKNIWRMNTIMNLRSLGLSTKEIGEYFANHSVESSKAMLKSELDIINSKLSSLENLKQKVLNQTQNIQLAESKKYEKVNIIEIEERRVFEIKHKHTANEEADYLMQRLVTMGGKGPFFIGNNRLASVISDDDGGHLYDAAWMFDEDGDKIIPGGKYLSIYYKGESNSRYYQDILIKYAKRKKIELVKPFFDIMWIDIHSSSDETEHVYEVQVLTKIK